VIEQRRSLVTQTLSSVASPVLCQNVRTACTLVNNKTRQGYARERILKPAGYFFVAPKSAALCGLGGAR